MVTGREDVEGENEGLLYVSIDTCTYHSSIVDTITWDREKKRE